MGLKKASGLQNYIPAFKYAGLEIYVSDGTPTESGPAKGALAIDTTNGLMYINTGTVAAATWSVFEAGTALLSNLIAANGAAALDTNGNAWLKSVIVASAVNYLTISNAIANAGPIITPNGDNTDIPLTLAPKGSAPLIINAGSIVGYQEAPSAQTTSAVIALDGLFSGIITVNQGAGGVSNLQLPTATDMDAATSIFVGVNNCIEFSLINISTVAAEDANITTNTGWTLVGSMAVASNAAATDKSSGRFKARRTGTAAWTLYRLS